LLKIKIVCIIKMRNNNQKVMLIDLPEKIKKISKKITNISILLIAVFFLFITILPNTGTINTNAQSASDLVGLSACNPSSDTNKGKNATDVLNNCIGTLYNGIVVIAVFIIIFKLVTSSLKKMSPLNDGSEDANTTSIIKDSFIGLAMIVIGVPLLTSLNTANLDISVFQNLGGLQVENPEGIVEETPEVITFYRDGSIKFGEKTETVILSTPPEPGSYILEITDKDGGITKYKVELENPINGPYPVGLSTTTQLTFKEGTEPKPLN
jgi:hypothetical protein